MQRPRDAAVIEALASLLWARASPYQVVDEYAVTEAHQSVICKVSRALEAEGQLPTSTLRACSKAGKIPRSSATDFDNAARPAREMW